MEARFKECSMNRLLVLVGIGAMLAACAQPPKKAAAVQAEPGSEAAQVAALLGYHGPANRPSPKYGD
jgi:uncharacterized lipoprotein YajG